MPRCENCGKDNPATICASCMHHKKKEALRAAKEGRSVDTPREPTAPPDLDALRDRLRRVEEGLSE